MDQFLRYASSFLLFVSLLIICVKKFQILLTILVPIFLLFHTRARKKHKKSSLSRFFFVPLHP